jgi:hypothetical protein
VADLTIEDDDGTLKNARMRTLEESTDTPSVAGVGRDGVQDRRNIQGLRELIISWEASR